MEMIFTLKNDFKILLSQANGKYLVFLLLFAFFFILTGIVIKMKCLSFNVNNHCFFFIFQT
ncbi:hypothetical protein B9J09_01950 [Xylella fastidiosa subsp. pauca]|nr:hypothetical protein B9J09_01950 [Xylella fastidiosa subsp. pauca]KIA59172.1 hypothetical protein RA12_01875 [Xylella fastidiosa]KXB15355.1 hypothetical protein ADT29_03885 [Xylella fastidiosa]KXB17413.1 hypothetical protein ADT31_04490 [Xylella fastidiosa]KXB21033.1 hypothetical protein ADT30_05335 [Xylella fastidiosa]